MDFATLRADLLPELFEQARATPRKLLAFRSRDGIRFEAALYKHEATAYKAVSYTMYVYVRAEQYDDDIRCDYESGEDWVRKALEGSGLEFIEETPETYDENHWDFSRVSSASFYADESKFWTAALEELKRAQATHACKCGNALTANDVCPACWASAACAAAEPAAPPAVKRRRSERSERSERRLA